MSVFDIEIIEIEGGYSNDPHDLGGETKYGISRRSYPQEDIKNLTVDRAIEIYIRDIWNPNRLGEINNQITANIIFRFIVHAGAYRAVKLLQQSINEFLPVTIDGVIGSQTLKAINTINDLCLQNTLRVTICRYYLRLVTRIPSQEKFFKGWIKRALM